MVATSRMSKQELAKTIDRLTKLREQGGASAFERATLMVRLFHDENYRATVPSEGQTADDDEVAAWLSQYVADFPGWQYCEFAEMLRYYPNKEQWASGFLVRMRAEMLKAEQDIVKSKTIERAMARQAAADKKPAEVSKPSGASNGTEHKAPASHPVKIPYLPAAPRPLPATPMAGIVKARPDTKPATTNGRDDFLAPKPVATRPTEADELVRLQRENDEFRARIRELEIENSRLKIELRAAKKQLSNLAQHA